MIWGEAAGDLIYLFSVSISPKITFLTVFIILTNCSCCLFAWINFSNDMSFSEQCVKTIVHRDNDFSRESCCDIWKYSITSI